MAFFSPRHLLTGIVFSLVVVSATTAQDLLLQYDFFTGDVSYYRYYVDGKTYQTVENTVGRGSRVVVRVINLNQNIYSVNSLSTGRPIELPERSINLLTSLVDARRAAYVSASAPTRDRWETRLESSRLRSEMARRSPRRSSGSGGAVDMDVSSVARSLMARIRGQEGAFQASLAKFHATVDQTVGRAAPLGGLLESAAESRNMAEAAVKRQVIEILQSVLGDAPQGRPSGFSVADIVKYSSNAYGSMSSALNDVEKLYIELDESYEQMLALVEKYPSALGIAVSDTTMNGGFVPVERWIQNDHRNEIRARLDHAIGMLDALRAAWNDYFREIAELYTAIQAMSFNYQYEVVATEDRVSIPIEIHDRGARAERARGDAVRLVASRLYTVPVVGGWKINTSIGVAGGYFFRHQITYGLLDGRITSAVINRFTPMGAALVHLYHRNAGPVAFGPTIGIGLSLNDLRALQFMLGGSLVMGDQEHIVLSAGMLGGQVAKLSPGFSIGSTVNGSTIPTEAGFDVGLFVGMSYGLFGR